jgi:hypothetical protein
VQTVLIKIKRLIIAKSYVFTLKAEAEMFRDSLSETDVLESILNANGVKKTLRSKNPFTRKPEKLYIIESFTYDGLLVYTKGKIAKDEFDRENLYVLISSKRSL